MHELSLDSVESVSAFATLAERIVFKSTNANLRHTRREFVIGTIAKQEEHGGYEGEHHSRVEASVSRPAPSGSASWMSLETCGSLVRIDRVQYSPSTGPTTAMGST